MLETMQTALYPAYCENANRYRAGADAAAMPCT